MRLPEPASRGRGRTHRLFHPLCNASPGTLARLLLQGRIAAERAHVVAIALAMTGLRLPFTLAQVAACAVWLRLRGSGPAPVFVVGHWRSGTTHPSARMISTLLRPLSLRRSGMDAASLVRHIYPRLMRDSVDLPAGRFVEVRCDDLRRRPLSELERAHRTLSLPGFAAYLDSVSDYAPHGHQSTQADAAWMAKPCAAIFRHGKYDLPALQRDVA
jgi:hypothetical protein